MNLRSTDTEWGAIAQWLHWGMALLIAGLMVLGWTAREWPVSPFKVSLFFWHKSIGILVLALAVVRLSLHFLDRRPGLPATSSWERFLARFSHLTLYALMLAMPLSGWVINSAAKFP
ncbi:MAG: cytochrome b/b6 domain-containing protein, partial [Gammaproteobacteria bacterium]|nr:cytochrome b/b6 domain-containing protein [Gammaproteobacteria bacterium]